MSEFLQPQRVPIGEFTGQNGKLVKVTITLEWFRALTALVKAVNSNTSGGEGTGTTAEDFAPLALFQAAQGALSEAAETFDLDQTSMLADAFALASALSNLGTGIVVKTGPGQYVVRTLQAGSGVTIENADGVAGDPIISSVGAEPFGILAEDGRRIITEDNRGISQEHRTWVSGAILTQDGLDWLVTEAGDRIVSEG